MAAVASPFPPHAALAGVVAVPKFHFSFSACGGGRVLALRPSLFGVARRQVWCFLQLKDDRRGNVEVGAQSYYSKMLTSSRSGELLTPCNELCTVSWNVEADVLGGYLIYVTGDHVSLGCWIPERAVPLSPSRENKSIWIGKIKVAPGINFKYNYFMKSEGHADASWRPGPTYSLSVPSFDGATDVIVVRDSWTRMPINGLPIPSWGSWLMENNFWRDLPINGEHSGKDRDGSDLPLGKDHGDDLCGKHFMEIAGSIKSQVCDSREILFDRDQPVEEPWLLSNLFYAVKAKKSQTSGEEEAAENTIHLKTDGAETFPILDSGLVASAYDPSTVILVNSSVLSMQRIAVLEDGKLVELLLEHIRDTVQCDSIYLGTILQLVPRMGSAFVDIGSRSSLLRVKGTREPFLFRPLNKNNEESAGKADEYGDSVATYPDLYTLDNSHVIDELDFEQNDDQLGLLSQHPHVDDENFDISSDLLVSAANGSIKSVLVDADDDKYDESGDEKEHNISRDDSSESLVQEEMKQSVIDCTNESGWLHVCKGSMIIVQVIKEERGAKGPALTAYPKLKSRFWILSTRSDVVDVSDNIVETERMRLKHIAKALQPPGFGLEARTAAAGHSAEELERDLNGLLSTWKSIIEQAKSAALASERGVKGAVPVILHRAMDQILLVAQDYLNEKVKSMIIDSRETYDEVTTYLQENCPELLGRVELYTKRTPIFDEFNIEAEIDNILCDRVPLPNGCSLVIEETEALVSIDVDGGQSMVKKGKKEENAILEANLIAVKQIAHEIRLRDIGGIILVDFIDMFKSSSKRLVYEEMKKATERDRSACSVSELSNLCLMEITRKRVRPSVAFMICSPCSCCQATGRLEALDITFSRIEREICRTFALLDQKSNPENPKSWPRFVLRVDRFMYNYLTSTEKTKLAVLGNSLNLRVHLEIDRNFVRGKFELKPIWAKEAVKPAFVSPPWLTEPRANRANTKSPLFLIKNRTRQGQRST